MGSLTENLQRLALQFPPFMIAVVFHEFAHGFIANQWGDPTAKENGRLTLNPVPHIDMMGTLIFPIINMVSGMNILFGWAKPVPIDPRRFRKFRAGLFFVSLAGPGMNFLLAILSAAACLTFKLYIPETFYLYDPLWQMALISVQLNFALGIFNLIPLPPLDGSKMVESFLPLAAMQKYEKLSKYSFFILMALLLTGAFQVLSYPIRFCTNATLILMENLFHVSGAI